MAASCGQPLQLSAVPRGARTGLAPVSWSVMIELLFWLGILI
jgi:hypothetical protein